MAVLDIFTRPGSFLNRSPIQWQLESPNQTSYLTKVVYSEYFLGETSEITRESALQVPAIKKARDVLVSVYAGCPWVEYDNGTPVRRPWLENSQSGISPWHLRAAVIDDLLFYDWSCLLAEVADGEIVDAVRVPFHLWTVDEYTGETHINDAPVPDGFKAILIPGTGSGGLLSTGSTTIKGALALQKAWTGRALNPIPLLDLHRTDDAPIYNGPLEDELGNPIDLDKAESDALQQLIDDWAAARLSPNGAVGSTPPNIELRELGSISADMFENGRNAAVLEVARLTGVPAGILDGSQSTATLTYSTKQGDRNEFLDFTAPIYVNPIEARLSLDDVTPAGRVIRVDKSSLTSITADPITQPTRD